MQKYFPILEEETRLKNTKKKKKKFRKVDEKKVSGFFI
jgi:hypothetical protein